MKQAQLPLKFLLRLILAIAFVLVIISVFSKVFRLSDKGLESYYELLEEINDPSFENGERRSLVLHMDRETAIIGVVKNSEEFYVTKENGRKVAEMEKNEECANDRACLCLCRSGLRYDELKEKYECKKMICKEVSKSIDFQREKKFVYKEPPFPDVVYFHNGFIIARDVFVILGGIKLEAPSKVIYLEKWDNVIYVCDKAPCLNKGASEE